MSTNKIIQIMPAPADLFAKFTQKDKSIDPSWTQSQDWFYEMEAGLNPGDESSVVLFIRVICLALMSDGQIAGVPFEGEGVFEVEHDAVGYAFKRFTTNAHAGPKSLHAISAERNLALVTIKPAQAPQADQTGPCPLGSISFKLAPTHPLIEVLQGHGVAYDDKHGNEIAYGVLCEHTLIWGSGSSAMEYGGTLRHDTAICRAGREEAAK